MIRTSSHTTKFTNTGKLNVLNEFIIEYRDAVEFYLNHVWNSVSRRFNTPKFISTKTLYPDQTNLSQRALKCASTQACGMVKAAVSKRAKQLFILRREQRLGSDISKLQHLIDTTEIVKPSVPYSLPAELNSICADFQPNRMGFDGFIQLKSLGKKFGKIKIPIKFSKHSNKFRQNGDLKPSFLIQSHTIHFRWELNKPKIKRTGSVRGVDQGAKTVISISDGQTTKSDNHGHNMDSIMKSMASSKKGSKRFKRLQDLQKNYVNWSINQLNLSDIKELRFEKLYQVGKNTRVSRYLSHFNYTIIKEKMVSMCEMSGVQFIEQDNVYRSQRCNRCGYVHKSNRKGKSFSCRHCEYSMDADMNAALNHEVNIMKLPYGLWRHKLNKIGFFWKSNGLFNNDGQALTVPDGKY